MIFDCFKFRFNKQNSKSKRRNLYWDESSKDYEYSSTVYLQPRMIYNVEGSEISSDPEVVEEACPFLNLKSVQLTIARDFCDIFRLSYQKCLYGPLTIIPRPLNYDTVTNETNTIATGNILSIKVCSDDYLK